MSGDFLDSNVFIYLFDKQDTRKQRVATEIVAAASQSPHATISHQVVQETLNAMLRLTALAPTQDDAADFLANVLLPLWRVAPTAGLFSSALGIHRRYQYSFYDSLIIAAALAAGCDRLLTEDLQHGQRIEGLTIHNPFL